MNDMNEMPPLPSAGESKSPAPSIMNDLPPMVEASKSPSEVEPPVVEEPVVVIGGPNSKSPLVDSKKVVDLPKVGIKVRAIHAGFFAQNRRAPGDEFLVPDRKNLGKWMECLDPKEQKLHEAVMAEKKSKHRELIVGH